MSNLVDMLKVQNFVREVSFYKMKINNLAEFR
jgi:hypothetical protein